MKIVLFSLNASRVHTNLAIRCLADSLKRQGFSDVRLIERTEKDRSAATLAALVNEKADLYGFSTYIWNVERHLTLAENLKKLLPNAHILFGGPEVSYHGDEFLDKHPFIDHLIRGEGEDAIVSLCRELQKGQNAPRLLDGGVFSAFTETPMPYSVGEDYRDSILYYESSRGCPYACTYCLSSLHTHPRVRAKSVEDTLADLRLIEQFEGIRIVKFVDRTFNFDRKRALAIWEALLSPAFTKHYHFEICASLLDEEALALLARFPRGRIRLEIGVQSTNPFVLAAINRRDDTAAVLANLEKLMALGNMHIHADLIAGLPHEDYSSIARSFDALYGKCHMLQLGFLKLLHGSPLEKQRDRYHYVTTAEAPYEVLVNDTLSFDEVMRLHKLEAVLERFGNSGRFQRAMALLVEDRSPFAVFESLAAEIPEVTLLSQREAYVALLSFEESLASHTLLAHTTPPERVLRLKEALALDFLLNEQGHLPRAIAFEKTILSHEDKFAFSQQHPEAFLPAVEAYDLPLTGKVFVDRKNKLLHR